MQPAITIDNDKTVLFISDLHIDSENNSANNAKQLIKDVDPDILFIVGDLFAAAFGWMEPSLYDKYSLIRFLDKMCEKGKKVIWCEGNHEFGLKQLKSRIATADSVIINIGNRKVYIAHGDLIDKSNIKYRIFRFLTKNSVSISIAKLLPQKALLSFARATDHIINGYKDISTKMRGFAMDGFEKGFDVVILGHSHIADSYSDGHHSYFNIGNFVTHKDYLIYKNGKFTRNK